MRAPITHSLRSRTVPTPMYSACMYSTCEWNSAIASVRVPNTHYFYRQLRTQPPNTFHYSAACCFGKKQYHTPACLPAFEHSTLPLSLYSTAIRHVRQIAPCHVHVSTVHRTAYSQRFNNESMDSLIFFDKQLNNVRTIQRPPFLHRSIWVQPRCHK